MTTKVAALLTVISSFATAGAYAKPLQGELEIEAASRIERNAGVWLDGQYVGRVDELDGRGRLVLVPGEHQLTFKLNGYEDVTRTINVEPGSQQQHRVAMSLAAGTTYPAKENTAQLRLKVKPDAAAIFINERFIGTRDSFGGRAGIRLSAGTYRVTIALPGYEPFNAELTLRAGQTYEVETKLAKGRLDGQAQELTARTPANGDE